jgi:hypothetical protein
MHTHVWHACVLTRERYGAGTPNGVVMSQYSGGSRRALMMAFDFSSACRLAASCIFFSIDEGTPTPLALPAALAFPSPLSRTALAGSSTLLLACQTQPRRFHLQCRNGESASGHSTTALPSRADDYEQQPLTDSLRLSAPSETAHVRTPACRTPAGRVGPCPPAASQPMPSLQSVLLNSVKECNPAPQRHLET